MPSHVLFLAGKSRANVASRLPCAHRGQSGTAASELTTHDALCRKSFVRCFMALASFPHLRIVVVDDNEEVRHLVSSLLHLRQGLELVGEASDGMAAVQLVNELEPDIVLMDIDTPRLNGIEATKQITSRVPQSRVIGFSSSTDAPTRTAMKEAGSVALVAKEEIFDLPDVIEQIMNPFDPA